MKYYSTRKPGRLYDLRTAARQGLAPDGGLFMPGRIPEADMEVIRRLAEKPFSETAAYLAGLFFGEDVPENVLNDICRDAYDFEVPLHRFTPDIATLELFRGPTLAFKDFGARFMARMFRHLFPDEKIVVLTATSGDTGSAVAAGFKGIDNIDVYILYPRGRVSDFQERQMTTPGENIHAVCVDGSFDDCQALVKNVFNDRKFSERHHVTSANSISLLRWIPQSFYYFYGYAQWKRGGGAGAPVIAVPSGNFGNLTAGMTAHQMGLPVERFIACTNANDVIPEFLRTGEFSPRESAATLSNAMDVGNPSNYERLADLTGHSLEKARALVTGARYTDRQTLETIEGVYRRYGYLIDPHSAIGYAAMRDIAKKPGFFLSTAHYSKFGNVIEPLLNLTIEYPDSAMHYFEKEKKFVLSKNDPEEIRRIILGNGQN